MALSTIVLSALKAFEPSSLQTSFLPLFEFLKYDTDDLRNEKIILKDELLNRFKKSEREKTNATLASLRKTFDAFSEILYKLRLLEDEGDSISGIKWEKISDICNILRKIESSDEKKVRWSLLYALSKGSKKIAVSQIKSLLANFEIPNIDRTLQKIIKIETESGLDVSFDEKTLVLNTEEKLAEHYIADAIEEKSRRSPGEIEKEVLELLDEGSYSNQEISRVLELDEAMVSRVMTKLRNQNKLVLSSFGNKGFRYYTTNCQNCPFGKTYSSCRKDAISYIVNAFKEAFDIDLTSQDFEEIETNQALLGIKRTITMSKKYTMTKLESNMYENFEKLLQMAVKNSIKTQQGKNKKSQEIVSSSDLSKLPKIFQMGLKVGMEYEIQLMKNKITDAKKNKQEASEVFSSVIKDSNKLLKSISN